MAAAGGALAREQILVVRCGIDHNGAFCTENIGRFVGPLLARADVVVQKVHNLRELQECFAVHAPRASTMILAGHGHVVEGSTEYSIKMTRDASIDSPALFEGLDSTACRRVILLSCSTGNREETSLAARIARTGRDVLAPTRKFFPGTDVEMNPFYGIKDGAFPVNISCGRLFLPDGTVRLVSGYEEVSTKKGDLDLLARGVRASTVAQRASSIAMSGNLDTAALVIRRALEASITADMSEKKRMRPDIQTVVLQLLYEELVEEAGMILKFTDMFHSPKVREGVVQQLIQIGDFETAYTVAEPLSDPRCIRRVAERFLTLVQIEKGISLTKKLPDGEALHGLIPVLFSEDQIDEGLKQTLRITTSQGMQRVVDSLLDEISCDFIESVRDRETLFSFIRKVNEDSRLMKSPLARSFSPLAEGYFNSLEAEDFDSVLYWIDAVCKSDIKEKILERMPAGAKRDECIRVIQEVLAQSASEYPLIEKLLHAVWEIQGKEDRGEGLAFGPNHLFDSPLLFTLALSLIEVDHTE